MSDYVPTYGPETCLSYTVTLTGTVSGGDLVTWAGARAGTASTNVAGVAGQDGVSGDKITVWGNGHHKLASSGTVNQGDPLCAGAAGVIRAAIIGTDAANSVIGRAKAAAASNVVNASIFGV